MKQLVETQCSANSMQSIVVVSRARDRSNDSVEISHYLSKVIYIYIFTDASSSVARAFVVVDSIEFEKVN